MSEWVEIKFRDFIKLNRGFDLPNDQMIDGEYPVVASTNIKGFHNKYKINPPAVITGRSGSLGTVQYIDTKCVPLNTTLYVKDFKRNIPKFVYYYLQTMHLEAFNSGAGVPTLNQNHLHSLKLLIPDFPTQTRIAEILSAYDDAIENNNRRIALLEKAARELYREWFVRFRFPGYEGATFVNGLPEGWEVIPLGDMVNITSSKRIYLSDYVEDGIPFYRSKEVIQSANGDVLTEPLYISVDKYTELKDKFGAPCENDILITSVGTIGVSLLVDKRIFYFKDGNLTWLQSGTKPEFALYTFLWLNSDIGKGALLSSAIGTSQSALTIENLKRIKLIKPSDTVLSEFYGSVMPLVELKRALQAQSQNLACQRDLFLPRLMSGKLEVISSYE